MSDEIKVKIGGDASPWERACKKARSAAQATTAGIRSAFSGIGNVFGKIGGMATGLAAFAGIGLGGAAVKSWIDNLDNIGKKSRNLGVSAEFMQKLEYAAESVNMPVEKLNESLPKLNKLIDDAAGGNVQAQSKIKALGLDLKMLAGANTEQRLAAAANAINRLGSHAAKNKAAMDLFGESGAQLLNFLAEYQAAGARLEALGGVVSNADVAAAEAFNQACTDVGKASSWMGGVKRVYSAACHRCRGNGRDCQ